jgi:ADP-ribose pyrophosphatase YjhB (NUDIX family)
MKPQRTRVAAYALVREEDRLLLCRLSAQVPRWQGYWILPGGGVEFGEPPEEAMIREVREETGLIVESEGIAGVDSYVDTLGAEDRHAIRLLYFARVVGGVLRHEVGGSTDRCEWHDLVSINRLDTVELVRTGVRMLRFPSTGAVL